MGVKVDLESMVQDSGRMECHLLRWEIALGGMVGDQ